MMFVIESECYFYLSMSQIKIITYILAMFDTQNQGSVDIHQFSKLYEYINQWLGIFKTYDRNNSGLIDDSELNQGKIIAFSLLIEKYSKLIQISYIILQHFPKWVSIFRPVSQSN